MTDYVVPQFITDYIQGGIYHPDSGSEPHNNQPLPSVQPTLTANGDEYNFGWRLDETFDFAALGIIGFKVVGEFDGSGTVAWSWEIDNPGNWTSGDGSFIAWDNAYSGGPLTVAGPTSYEHTFALTDTASDPTYEGLSYSDPLGDLDYSLHATEDVAEFDHAFGTVGLVSDGSLQVLRWDLILFTEVVTGGGARGPVARLWPRDDGRGISSAPRIWPPTKANRIIGGYP